VKGLLWRRGLVKARTAGRANAVGNGAASGQMGDAGLARAAAPASQSLPVTETAVPAARTASLERATNETRVAVDLNIDGSQRIAVATGIGFFDHMLSLFAFQAGFDLALQAQGDLHVDQHHTVEDVGLTLGAALCQALGDKRGIARYGFVLLPMDEALAEVALDLSGRPLAICDLSDRLGREPVGDFDPRLTDHFWRSFVSTAGVTLHVRLRAGEDPHHGLEAVFKAVGRSLRQACARSSTGALSAAVPSSKGVL